MEKFDDVDNDELLEVLSEHNGKVMVNKQNIGNVIDQIAHKELVHEPVFVRLLLGTWSHLRFAGVRECPLYCLLYCWCHRDSASVLLYFTLQTNKKVFDVINCIW